MKKKAISAAVVAAALVILTLAVYTENGEPLVEPGTETQQEIVVSTELETETETETGTEAAEEVVSTESETETETETESPYPEIYSDDKIKEYQNVVVVGDTAYELYSYLDDVADNYAKTVNKVAKSLDGIANVYDMVIPLSSGITFPDNLLDKIASTDQREAMETIEGKLSKKVHVVDIYDSLMEHRDEYIYFRTDHHWTTLGAYYAYEDLCEAMGIEPEALDSYETKEFDGFIGSFYNDTKDAKLKTNPDTVVAYYPHADSILHVTASDDTEYDWPVIYDVSNYSESLKYSAFIASDNPYTEIVNNDLDDGSACIVVKESFGNALVPFLVDHYQTIYVIDYRYWTGSISELAQEKDVQDVIFLNNLSMIRNKSLVGKLHRVK
jgi:hypothetical protein